ncbi:PT domain-containing protein [Paenibacillus sp. FSL P4-0081]|uniref:PT domain-containing protein n=1 Tax=Paenibacillus sp. FSL P4-0081 TaxID=1536769 RepID=UPI0007C87824|nr:PT domain-containing protein [Paenibacillus sp. FSL P4-0081]
MKKKIAGFLVLCTLFFILIPGATKAAEQPVGLLDGLVINIGSNQNNKLGTTTAVTDNNESTYFSMVPEISNSTIKDCLFYNFSTPVDINAYKLYLSNYTGGQVSIFFIDNNGTTIAQSISHSVIPGDNNIYPLSSPITNVKTVVIWQYSAVSYNIAEFNLYNIVPIPTATPSVEPTATPTIEPTATPEATIEPTPTVTALPTPSPTSEQSTGDRAILVVTMSTGLEKEFDLSMAEVNAFIAWYENKLSGSGTASYAIDKHDNNKGPFTNRKDYMIFDKILTFSVDEYSAE